MEDSCPLRLWLLEIYKNSSSSMSTFALFKRDLQKTLIRFRKIIASYAF